MNILHKINRAKNAEKTEVGFFNCTGHPYRFYPYRVRNIGAPTAGRRPILKIYIKEWIDNFSNVDDIIQCVTYIPHYHYIYIQGFAWLNSYSIFQTTPKIYIGGGEGVEGGTINQIFNLHTDRRHIAYIYAYIYHVYK